MKPLIYAKLNSTAITEEANRLIDTLTTEVKATEGPRSGRGKRRSTQSIGRAIGAFLGDLLAAQKLGGPCVRSLMANSFTGEAIGRSSFLFVVDALTDLGYVSHTKGKPHFSTCPFPGPPSPINVGMGKASEFRATEKLLSLCGGVSVADFVKPFPDYPVELRASSRKVRGDKEQGEAMEFDRSPEVQLVADKVTELNTFLGNFEMAPYRFSGLVRKFQQGDAKGFRWNKGGRLYAHGPVTYQTLKKEERKRLTIDGEKAVEVDVQASHLAIFHGLMDQPFDSSTDPYALDGFPRDVVKAWVTATFGNNKPLDRWPSRLSRAYEEKHGEALSSFGTAKAVKDLMLKRFPVLAKWGASGHTWADLQFNEAEAILNAMVLMKKENRPAFPIHDCLLVRESDAEIAKRLLMASYYAYFEVAVLAR